MLTYEQKQREEWIRIRWQTFYLLQPNVKKGSLRRPVDLIRFDWEKEDLGYEEYKRLKESGAFDKFPDKLPDK